MTCMLHFLSLTTTKPLCDKAYLKFKSKKLKCLNSNWIKIRLTGFQPNPTTLNKSTDFLRKIRSSILSDFTRSPHIPVYPSTLLLLNTKNNFTIQHNFSNNVKFVNLAYVIVGLKHYTNLFFKLYWDQVKTLAILRQLIIVSLWKKNRYHEPSSTNKSSKLSVPILNLTSFSLTKL